MSKKYFLIILFFSLLILPNKSLAATAEVVKIPAPYTSEIPTGTWAPPWNNACEEATIVMVNDYYFGYETLPKKIAADNMNPLFKIENKIFGGNANTDASQTAQLINDYTDSTAVIKENPTIDEIKNELRQNRPVITFHYAKNIVNVNYHWRAGGSYYHVMTLVGFDDNTKEFFVHDSGDPVTGAFHRYGYDVIMNSLHDYNHKTRRADGTPRVLFTDSKVLFKDKNSSAVYLIRHNIKYPIANSKVFLDHGWKWSKIHTVNTETLQKFQTGELIES